MKSKLFSQFDPSDEDNKDFAPTLKALLELDEKTIGQIVQSLPAFAESKTYVEKENVVQALEKETSLPRIKLSAPVSSAGFFLNALLSDRLKGDDGRKWAADLIELGLLSKEKQSLFLAFVKKLKQGTAPRLEVRKREDRADVGVLPSFVGASTTVEFRAVLKERFKWGNKVENFSPEVESMRPIISVSMQLDSGSPSRFSFQATPDELNYLIAEFQAAQKAAKVMEKNIRLKG